MKLFATTTLLLSCLLAKAQCIETKCPVVNRLYCQADSLAKGLMSEQGEFRPEYIKALNKLYSARVAARNCEGGRWVQIIDARIFAISTKVDSLRQAAERAAIKAKQAENLSRRSEQKALKAAHQADRSAQLAQVSARLADSSARLTEASRLITLATQFRQDDPTLALQLIKKACDTSRFHSEVAVQELLTVLSKTHPASYYKKKIEDTSAIASMAVSANGQRLITGHNDGTLSIWNDFRQINGRQSKPISLATLHKGAILSIAISHDGKQIVSGGIDGTIVIWGDQEVQRTLRLRETSLPVLSVALSADERYVVSSHEDRRVVIWDIRSGDRIANQLVLTSGNAVQVCFSPDGQHIGIAGSDETVRVWEWAPNKQVAILEEHRGAVRSVAFSPDGAYIVSGGDDKTVRIWKWQHSPTSRLAPAVNGHLQPVLSVAFSPVTNFLVSAGQDNVIKVWTLTNDTLALLHTVRGHQKPVFATGFCANSPYLYSGSYDRSVKLWNWQQSARIDDSLYSHTAFLPSTTAVKLTGGASQRIIQSQPRYRLTLPASLQKADATFFYSLDQRYILARDNETTVWLWDYKKTSRPVFTITTSVKGPFSLSSDTSFIQSGQHAFRNLYYELINDRLIPTMTSEDRASYLLSGN